MFNLETLCVLMMAGIKKKGTDAWQCPSVHRWLVTLSLTQPTSLPSYVLLLISSEEKQVPSINKPLAFAGMARQRLSIKRRVGREDST